jgi:hypothetical protein
VQRQWFVRLNYVRVKIKKGQRRYEENYSQKKSEKRKKSAKERREAARIVRKRWIRQVAQEVG